MAGRTGRYHKISYSAEGVDRFIGDLSLESHRSTPKQIVLDLDATDIPLYGHQAERFFQGYYSSYCYLPLSIFVGEQLLCARLRAANEDAAARAVEEVGRIVLRGDSGFRREELMGWCEANQVNYLFGLARNQRLQKTIGAQMQQARVLHKGTAKTARVFTGFSYTTRKSWSRAPACCQSRVSRQGRESAIRAYVVDSGAVPDQALYEKFYCAAAK